MSRKSYVSQSFDDLWSCIVMKDKSIDQVDQQFELKEVWGLIPVDVLEHCITVGEVGACPHS